MDSPDLQFKYQKLAFEYSKLRAQNQVLKRAVKDEQEKGLQLKENINTRDQSLRKAEQELDSLSFRNQQLTKRLALLQKDLEVIKNRVKKGGAKSDSVESNYFNDSNVYAEELESKIQENARLHAELKDLEAFYKNKISELESKLEEFSRNVAKRPESIYSRDQPVQTVLDSIEEKGTSTEEKCQQGDAKCVIESQPKTFPNLEKKLVLPSRTLIKTQVNDSVIESLDGKSKRVILTELIDPVKDLSLGFISFFTSYLPLLKRLSPSSAPYLKVIDELDQEICAWKEFSNIFEEVINANNKWDSATLPNLNGLLPFYGSAIKCSSSIQKVQSLTERCFCLQDIHLEAGWKKSLSSVAFCFTSVIPYISVLASFKLDCTSKVMRGKISKQNEDNNLKKSQTCSLKKYNERDYEECLRIKGKPAFNIGFVGSEFVEEFFSYFTEKYKITSRNSYIANSNNSSKLISEIEDDESLGLNSKAEGYKSFRYVDESFSNFIKKWPGAALPDVIVMGFNPFNFDKENFNNYINNVSDLSFQLDVLGESSTLFWIVPYFKIYELNGDYFEKHKGSVNRALKASHVKLWEIYSNEDSSPELNEKLSQVILNYLCNNKLEPNSTSLCCSGLERKARFERRLEIYITISVFVILLFFVYAYFKKGVICNFISTTVNKHLVKNVSLGEEDAINEDLLKIDENNKVSLVVIEKGSNEKKHDLNFCISFIIKCILIFSYFYVCDRTKLFEKKYKEFHAAWFYTPLFISLLVSFVFREKCSSNKPLNREITDEWKGWMQVVILIYHITGASSQIQIYMHIRILVSSYLFMTGFGNFCYYWQGGSLTFRRYCQVMLRMNVLTIMLCVVMKEYYQFYYFVPLVSFWYTFLFLLLLLPPGLSSTNSEGKSVPSKTDYVLTLVKFIVCGAAITVLGWSKEIFDEFFLFPLWKVLFILPGHEDQEWWFRWNLDKYSSLFSYEKLVIPRYASTWMGLNKRSSKATGKPCLTGQFSDRYFVMPG